MANQFFLSNNPNSSFDPQTDVFIVNDASVSAADLQITVSPGPGLENGTTVTFTAPNGHSATFTNVLLSQFDVFNVTFFDGSELSIGDNTADISNIPDNDPNTINATPVTNTGSFGPATAPGATANDDQILGFGGDDTIDGLGGSDLIYGNKGDDTITGSLGSDQVYGGQGNDTINYMADSSGVNLAGNLGADLIYGGTGDDTIFGNQFGAGTLANTDDNYGDVGDTIYAGAGADTVYGNQGDDVIIGTGDAYIQNNEYVYENVFGGQDNDTINYAGDAPYVATLHGNKGDDTIYASNAYDGDYVYGDEGNDTIYAASGTAGFDDYSEFNENIYGGDGNDTITGSGSYFYLNVDGGTGNDTINMAGSTVYYGDYGDSTIYGGIGADTITGTNSSDIIYGGDGLSGSTDSADTIDGGAGNDIIYGNQGNDSITGSTGSDTVYGGDGGDNIDYSADSSGVTLYGNLGSDTMLGGDGVDTLVAGDGTDKLTGNASNDTFDFSTGNGDVATFITGMTTTSADTITDFATNVDTLITGFGAGTLTNYQELSAPLVANVEDALSVYSDPGNNLDNPATTGPTYTFIAGATDGYLIVDDNGTASDGVGTGGVLRLTGLHNVADFASTDITNGHAVT